MRKSAFITKVCYYIALACIFIGIITIFPAMSTLKKAGKAEGTVSAIQESITYESDGNIIQHYPEIDYIDPTTGAEMTYTSDTNVSKNKYAVGDTVELLFVEKDGETDIRIHTVSTVWAGFIVMAIMAFLFAVIGFVFGFNRAKKNRLVSSLKNANNKEEVAITEIRKEVVQTSRNAAVQMSITFYVIYAKWVSPEGKEFTFKSENIARHPSEFGKDVGSRVTVYFDKVNPARHYIDLSFVPEKDLF